MFNFCLFQKGLKIFNSLEDGYLPIQLATHGQWWSNRAIQRLQTEQCFDRNGRLTKQAEQYEEGSNPPDPLSANSIIV